MNFAKYWTELSEELETFKDDLLKSSTNKSANRRARSKSIEIRKSLKSVREELLKLEKETK
jgi:hypothetical protein|tara:strand:- start:1359 stop:1541 length:183 start_codon:yes stop_codon:yes gene_type:complete